MILFAPAFRDQTLFIWNMIVFKKTANKDIEKVKEGLKYS